MTTDKENTTSEEKKKTTKKATAKKKTTKQKTKAKETKKTTKKAKSEYLFALDIGTRSVIGILAKKNDETLEIVDTARREHKTRAMLDGQIHDVPEVSKIIKEVKKDLEKRNTKLKSAAVAAAGRALYTITSEAENDVNGIITEEEERALDYLGVQKAQTKLAEDFKDNSTNYYCVGYSTISYTLDDVPLKTLVGQRGKVAKAKVIATFLPRQIIDSMQVALKTASLEMKALTLEPIAAINVLIPPTMRHLNLVLVDIGAGTSDVAVTKNGSIIAYGMVPMAGDEITEAISTKYLLDFNIAEEVKRKAQSGKVAEFTDILGIKRTLAPEEIIEPIEDAIKKLAEKIAQEILKLNTTPPQAVLLAGGGSLTPHLSKFVADFLEIPKELVAVRCVENTPDILNIPDELKLPDAVTPLGILKVASSNTLHFFTIFVNGEEFRLFNFRDLTVADALLYADIDLKKYNGRPGLGIMLTIDGKPEFIAGTMGTLARLTVDGKEATLKTPIKDMSRIMIEAGENGTIPKITLKDVIDLPEHYTIYINGREKMLPPLLYLNGEAIKSNQELVDGDTIETKSERTIGETLKLTGYPPTGKKITYKLNNSTTSYTMTPEILLNDNPATLSMFIHDKDRIEYIENAEPKLGDVLQISELDAYLIIYFNKAEYKIPSSTISLSVNGHPATLNTLISEGCHVEYKKSENKTTLVSTALLAVGFRPPDSKSRVSVKILVNGKEADFTDPIKNGDSLDIEITPLEKIEEEKSPLPLMSKEQKKESIKSETNIKPSRPILKDSLLGAWKKRH